MDLLHQVARQLGHVQLHAVLGKFSLIVHAELGLFLDVTPAERRLVKSDKAVDLVSLK